MSSLYLRAILLVLLLLFFVNCGGGNSSSSSVTVSISPTTATVTAGSNASFVATVSNTKNTAVTWQVNGVAGGNSTYGTITASGVFYAPVNVASEVAETITAVSTADTSKSATATVTLTPSNASVSTYLTVSPGFAVMQAGSQQTFVASNGSTNTNVTWSLSCQATLITDCGIISSTGIYTAPLAPPPGGNVTITATSIDGSVHPGSSAVTIQYSNATVAGRYALSFSGENGSTPIGIIGSVVFDGAGNITGGQEDSSSGSATVAITGGTYHIGTDGRGSATVQTSGGTATWNFVAVNHSHLFSIATDGSSTLSGTLDLQNVSQFDLGVINGGYSLLLRCPTQSALFAAVGQISTDGAGNISQGTEDINQASGPQTALAVTGSFTAPSSAGRGQLTISTSSGTQNLVYYIVDNTHLKLLQTSSTTPLWGEAVKQATGPFSAATLKGQFATVLYGYNSGNPVSLGAQITLDGAGSASAVADMNANGTVQATVSMTGTYEVTDAVSGRTELTLGANGQNYSFVFYPASGQDLSIAEMDNTVAAGSGFAEQAFSVSIHSLIGSFGTILAGSNLRNGNAFETGSGQLVLNGGGSFTGTLDIGFGGSTVPNGSTNGSDKVDSNGVVTLSLNTSSSPLNNVTYRLYPVDTRRFLLMEIDANGVTTAIAQVND